jgi:outer membrane usher protein
MEKKKHFKYYAWVTMFFFCPNIYAETNKQKTNNQDDTNDYVFDPSLFKGEGFNQSAIETLSRPNTLLPGTYKLDTYLNKHFLGNFKVEVTNDNASVKTCLPLDLLQQIGFKKLNFDAKTPIKCYALSEISPESSAKVDNSTLKLYLTVPQILLDLKPQGYVNPDSYDTGSNIGFVNYLANYYHVNFNGNQKNLDSVWLSLQGGINLASWQYRQQSNLTWNQAGGEKWQTSNRYVQRPIVSLESQLMAGQLVTNGVFLSGMSYTGINLHSSDAMLPDSQRGYAPIITGIANSNATVTVSQNGQSIYQTTVPPGAFTISDLYPTSFSGDLTVTIKEANGSEKSFAVPYSSLPESIRPGLSRYNLAVGKTRDTVKKANFVDLVYQRGLSNTISSNQAIRVAPNYVATMLGGVYSSPLGSIGLDGTFSRATLADNSRKQGWMAHISWSKVLETSGTSITLAGYRYSSEG